MNNRTAVVRKLNPPAIIGAKLYTAAKACNYTGNIQNIAEVLRECRSIAEKVTHVLNEDNWKNQPHEQIVAALWIGLKLNERNDEKIDTGILKQQIQEKIISLIRRNRAQLQTALRGSAILNAIL